MITVTLPLDEYERLKQRIAWHESREKSIERNLWKALAAELDADQSWGYLIPMEQRVIDAIRKGVGRS